MKREKTQREKRDSNVLNFIRREKRINIKMIEHTSNKTFNPIQRRNRFLSLFCATLLLLRTTRQTIQHSFITLGVRLSIRCALITELRSIDEIAPGIKRERFGTKEQHSKRAKNKKIRTKPLTRQ